MYLSNFVYDPSMKAPAMAVLALLSKTELNGIAEWDSENNKYRYDGKAYPFYNGRENGFVLQASNSPLSNRVINIYCSEHRSSDDIFVEHWVSKGHGINPPSLESPERTEEVYRNFRKFFPYKDIYPAYEYIKELIKNHLPIEVAPGLRKITFPTP